MPELPEVETIKRYFSHHVLGKTIQDITVLERKMFHGDAKSVNGEKITEVLRKGKVLVLKLSDNRYLSIHLKLSGQLLFHKNAKKAVYNNTIPLSATNIMPGRSTRIIIYFTDGSGVFFNDMRKFGWMKLSAKPEVPLSVDVLSPEFTRNYFHSILLRSKKPVKTLLMDQAKLAGIGNIYANDSLFHANVHPLRQANTLLPTERDTLYASILEIVKKGVDSHGSSGKDEVYILPDGSKGAYQQSFLVYQREGKPCRRCQTPIKRIVQAGRSSFYCPKCQLHA